MDVWKTSCLQLKHRPVKKIIFFLFSVWTPALVLVYGEYNLNCIIFYTVFWIYV